MADLSHSTVSIEALQAEVVRLNKIIEALMNRAERNASIQGSEFNLFQTAVMLEDKVRSRTAQLQDALEENEKVTRALREAKNNLRLLIDHAPVSIHEIDLEGRIFSMSRAGLEMHNRMEESQVVGTLFINLAREADRKRITSGLQRAKAGETCFCEFIDQEQPERVLESRLIPIVNKEGSISKIMGITEDITERKRIEKRIMELAYNDALTHLPNRRLLNNRLKETVLRSSRSGLYGAVLFLDLDNYKPLNDTDNHEFSDHLLIEVAQRITTSVRQIDTVARMRGGEFVVMLSELDADIELAANYAGAVAEKIRIILAKPYILHLEQEDGAETTVEHHCSASIAVKLFINSETSEEGIEKFVDKLMLRQKDSDSNAIKFYKPQDSADQEDKIASSSGKKNQQSSNYRPKYF
jgi:diguanylate cyclase (GGDEF)-like protein/PAS domain S-box-containing protein